jgi:hypothetical protein
MAIAANTEFPATARFSARIDAGLSIAGDLGMTALSPLMTSFANRHVEHISSATTDSGETLC